MLQLVQLDRFIDALFQTMAEETYIFTDIFTDDPADNHPNEEVEDEHITTLDLDFESIDKSFLFTVNNQVFKVDRVNFGTYIEDWKTQSMKLHVKRADDVRKAYNKVGPVGLFHLFLSHQYFGAVLYWTNKRLLEIGKKEISERQFNAYVGLELAMSLSELNAIEDYWSTKAFLGVKGFNDVMSRNQFTTIRSHVTFRPPGVDTPDIKHSYPLWHSRGTFKELLTNCMSIAFASGVVSLDESGIRTRAKCAEKTYIPSKPDKYEIRLYAINCWHSLYLQNFYDNGAGNSSSLSCAERYVHTFPKMRAVFLNQVKKYEDDDTMYGMDKEKQSWLWSLQLANITQKHRTEERKRLVVTDNYYTRPSFAKAAKVMSDGEIRVIGTCRTTYVGAPNIKNILTAIAKLKHSPRGSWMLVADHEQHEDHNKMKKEHEKR